MRADCPLVRPSEEVLLRRNIWEVCEASESDNHSSPESGVERRFLSVPFSVILRSPARTQCSTSACDRILLWMVSQRRALSCEVVGGYTLISPSMPREPGGERKIVCMRLGTQMALLRSKSTRRGARKHVLVSWVGFQGVFPAGQMDSRRKLSNFLLEKLCSCRITKFWATAKGERRCLRHARA